MESGLKYTIFETTAGWIAVLASARGLRQLTLPQPSAGAAQERLGRLDGAAADPEYFAELVSRVRFYFAARLVTFPDSLDLRGTAFQREVWSRTRLIPYGETRSYSWVAGQVGHPAAARAMGQALARNPLPLIVPCHRVVGHNGQLCGFTGGLRWKQFLLSLEGCTI